MRNYNELPKEIQELALIRSENYKQGRSKLVIESNLLITQMFPFDNTEEGGSFWHNINDGNYKVFYERYPKIENKIELISKEPIIYKAIVNNRKVKITIEYEDTIK